MRQDIVSAFAERFQVGVGTAEEFLKMVTTKDVNFLKEHLWNITMQNRLYYKAGQPFYDKQPKFKTRAAIDKAYAKAGEEFTYSVLIFLDEHGLKFGA
jgi:hypothetical protein